MKNLAPFLFAILLLTACNKDDDITEDVPPTSNSARTYNADFLHDYFTLQCDITRNTAGFLPTIAARSYGYLGLTAYESVVHGIPNAQSLQGQADGFYEGSLPSPNPDQVYNWALVCNAASAATMRNMFGSNLQESDGVLIDEMELENESNLSINEEQGVIERSIQYGKELAAAIFEVSSSDGGHESYLDPWQLPYNVEQDDYCWVPTGPQPQPLTPYWQQNRSFIANIAEKTQVEANIPFSIDPNSEFYGQAMDTYTQVVNNTPEEATIAEYLHPHRPHL
jgi:hypothetical protein